MYSNFKEQGIEYAKQAVQEDNAGNYAKALTLYTNALDYFKTHLKYEKNSKVRESITQRFMDYLRRAEELRTIVAEQERSAHAANGDAAMAVRSKPKLGDKKNGNGSNGEDLEQSKLRVGLHSAIIKEKPNVTWDDVAGLDSAKKALQEAVILPVEFPQFFTGKRKPWKAFLLYGPPGTGKSYLAKAVATEADSTFFSISSSDLVSKWMGESEKLVSNLFQMARENAPSIIFIDEIDSLVGQRGENNESEASRRLKTELLVQWQGVSNNDQKVLVLAATNTPFSLDQAIRRRFDKRIYIPLPEASARKHMFKIHLGDTPNDLSEADFEHLAERTDGFSGSDIAVCVSTLATFLDISLFWERAFPYSTQQHKLLSSTCPRCIQLRTRYPPPAEAPVVCAAGPGVCVCMFVEWQSPSPKTTPSQVKDVLFEPVRKTQDAMHFRQVVTNDGVEVWMPCGPRQEGAVEITMRGLAKKGLAAKILPPAITKADFDKVLSRQKPTVSKKDLQVYENFTKEFGEEG